MPTQQHTAVMAGFSVVLVALAFTAWRPMVRRTGRPSRATLGMLLAAAVCVSLTLPDQVQAGVVDRLHACVSGASARTFPGGPAHHAVNVVLWIPLGLFGALATRRPLVVTAVGSLAWVLIETAQTLDPIRSCQPVDWANNTAGILVGAVLGWLLVRRRSTPEGLRASTTKP
ncbi:VanZ family protein [Streptomyces boluensis]|uniref:VanZ-like domain-containing protein n=1 Tax=Streptomyces boluensis TaxID=1775135 RepID=A0A964US98_9ACTN|nr:VanZ family protein [Streptomyces boluensis]NBE53510.1 hypothetical protein [Streptomyces boluensis]